ncbi:MAG: Uma2 family endonuclease [Candidatus Competibacteraceae bacterium]|nr:Uma2 family endonuclease [Candidatus Competibacteraceae bacterium]
MPQLAEPLITPVDYLARERRSEVRSEYLNGRIYAMSGASREHNRITINLSAMLHSRLKGKPCEPFSGDLRVKVSPTGLYTYPDVIVVCGESRFEDEHVDTLLDPTVIIEVLSDSTEAYDRGEKFAHYRALESLTDYLLVAQDRPRIEHFVRQPDSCWLYSVTDGLDKQIEIATIDCVLPLAEVYERVVFSE